MKMTAAAVLLVLISVLPAPAQSGQRGPMMRHYDPKTEVTFTGTVESINRMAGMPGRGIHLTVKTGDETSNVHLGPAAFIERKMTFKKGDTVQITGSKVTMMSLPERENGTKLGLSSFEATKIPNCCAIILPNSFLKVWIGERPVTPLLRSH